MQECDVISISKSNYIYEYEVKISRSDFKADFKKPKHTLINEKKFIKETKNETFYLADNNQPPFSNRLLVFLVTLIFLIFLLLS